MEEKQDMSEAEAIAKIKEANGETSEGAEKKGGEPEKPTEEESKEVEEEQEEVGETKEELDLKSQEKVQARINEMTRRLREAERRAEEAEKNVSEKSDKSRPKSYTLDELRAIKADPNLAQYHAWAEEQIVDLKVEEKLKTFSHATEIQRSHEASLLRAIDEFPDLENKDGALWQKANEIFIRKGWGSNPDGEYDAAVLAYAELNKGKSLEMASVKRKLDRETAKKGLAGSSKKPAPESSNSKKAKLFAEAKKTGNFEEYFKTLVSEK